MGSGQVHPGPGSLAGGGEAGSEGRAWGPSPSAPSWQGPSPPQGSRVAESWGDRMGPCYTALGANHPPPLQRTRGGGHEEGKVFDQTQRRSTPCGPSCRAQRGSRGGGESLGSRRPSRWAKESIPGRFVACRGFSSTYPAACCHTLPFLQITFDEPFTLESTTHQNSSHEGAIQHYQSLIEAILADLLLLAQRIRKRESEKEKVSPSGCWLLARLRDDFPPDFASRLIIHQLDFPVPSFCTRTNLLCRDRLCRIEFWGEKGN